MALESSVIIRTFFPTEKPGRDLAGLTVCRTSEQQPVAQDCSHEA